MSTPLKLQKIVVKGLFDLFDHEIPLNQNEGVTVMLGPNGFGKTAILRMINEIFNSNSTAFHGAISKTVFQELTIFSLMDADYI